MTKKLTIESLPVTDRNLPIRRLVQDRGELALIEDGASIGHLTFFTIKAGPGLYRGAHVHERKIEHFYIARGRVALEWVDIDTGRKGKALLVTGDKATIFPHLAHRMSCLEDECFVVEYFEGCHDAHDDRPFHDFSE